MSEIKVGDYIQILNLLGSGVARSIEAYQAGRKLAKAAGVPEAAMQASDARWLRRHADPLAGEPAEPEPEPEPGVI